MRKAVFLDRDGVLNALVVEAGQARSPRSLEEFRIIPGTSGALAALRQAGYLLIVATNQPEVARGLQARHVVESMHELLRRSLPLDDIYVCYHDERDGCSCRKPAPGLLIDAARKWGIRLDESYMIGDRYKDMEAGRRAGCRTILLGGGCMQGEPPSLRAETVGEAAARILESQSESDPRCGQGVVRPSLVTVMMPAYNAERYIGLALESLLAQSYRDWELILVNDGSTDATAAIAARFDDPRIVVVSQQNAGEAAARNTALERARGEYLAFLDADDIYLPDHLERCVEYLQQHPEMEGVYTDGFYIDESGRRLKPLSARRRGPFAGDIFQQTVRSSDVFGTPLCVMLRRRSIVGRGLKFDPDIVIGPDWDFLTRFAEWGTFGYVESRTCLYRVHTANVSLRTRQQDRLHSLARCRTKAIKLERFGACSPETRTYVFYDLLVNLLAGDPEAQAAIVGWKEFADLPLSEQARLFRLMAVGALVGGQGRRVVAGWLRAARKLRPMDVRRCVMDALFALHPGLCRAVFRLKRAECANAMHASPFADLA